MATTLFVVQIVLAVFITIIVLLQKSSSIGLGTYSGSNESVFGAKGPAGFLSNTIALSYTYNQQSQKSVLDTLSSDVLSAPVSTESGASAFIVDENAAPSAPLLQTEPIHNDDK